MTETAAMRRGVSRDGMKYIAMLAMLVNHIGTIFVRPGLARELMLDVGYFTAITMCYFLVEGYRHTRSRKKYGTRLFLFALLSQLPFELAFSPSLEFQGGRLTGLGFTAVNMMGTLFLGFLILEARRRLRNPVLRSLAQCLLVFASILCDWALLAGIFVILFDSWYGSKRKLAGAYGIAVLLFAGFNYPAYVLYGYSAAGCAALTVLACGGMAVSGVAILFFYNGKRMERGQTFSKWFFYLFYPVHLLILGLARLAL